MQRFQKSGLEEAEEELKDQRDQRNSLEHQLASAEARAADAERRFGLLRDSQRATVGQAEHQALNERFRKLLAEKSELAERCAAAEAVKRQLSAMNASLERMTEERRQTEELLHREQATVRELRDQLKRAAEQQQLLKQSADEVRPGSSSPSLLEDLSALQSSGDAR